MFHCLALMDENYIFTLFAGDLEVKAKWTISLSVVSEARVGKLHTRARCVCALSIQRLEGRRWRLRGMRANAYGNSIF
jgi:hypothetical protein